jgi:hypothetical protein
MQLKKIHYNFHISIVKVSLHTEPFEVCKQTAEVYREMVLKYEELIETTDFHQENCKKKYFDGNKMNLLETMRDHADQLWRKGHCDGKIFPLTSWSFFNLI